MSILHFSPATFFRINTNIHWSSLFSKCIAENVRKFLSYRAEYLSHTHTNTHTNQETKYEEQIVDSKERPVQVHVPDRNFVSASFCETLARVTLAEARFSRELLRNRESLGFSIHPPICQSVSNPFHNSRSHDERLANERANTIARVLIVQRARR